MAGRGTPSGGQPTENRARVLRFPELPRPSVRVALWDRPGLPDLEALREQLVADGYQALRWDSKPDQMYLPHAHIYAELLWLVAGSLTLVLPEASRLLSLEPGDRVEIPAGTIHASQAGPEGALYLVATR